MRTYGWVCVAALVGCSGSDRPPVVGNSSTGTSPTAVRGGMLLADAGPICTSTNLNCEGQTPYRCNSDGTRRYETACTGARPFCAPGIGCLACLPASVRCNPDRAELPQRCADDGSRWIDQTACDTAAGQQCSDGRCGDPCAVPDGVRQYLGCSYWATQTPNSQLAASFPFATALANPQSFEVTVRVSGGRLSAPLDVMLAPGEVRAVNLPWVNDLVQFDPASVGCTGSSGARCPAAPPARSRVVTGGAYHIESTAPVAAYQFNPLTFRATASSGETVYSFTNDASLLLSQRSLTQRYLVLAAPNWRPAGSSVIFGGFIAVTAVSGETTRVTVRFPPGHGVPGAAADNTITRENLMPGDVAVFVGASDGDLSGAIVEASSSVAVFAGNDCTNVPSQRPACDHLEEQVLPLETLGRDYVVGPLRDRPLGALVRMVATTDDTVVRFEPSTISAPVRLRAGEVAETTLDLGAHISANRPILLAQFMLGQGASQSSMYGGDPAMVYEVPTQQYRDRYDVLVPATYERNFVSLVVPHGAQMLLDGAPIMSTIERVGTWDVHSAVVAPGRHQLRTREGVPFGVKIYGVARYTSYMYPGGLDLRQLPPG